MISLAPKPAAAITPIPASDPVMPVIELITPRLLARIPAKPLTVSSPALVPAVPTLRREDRTRLMTPEASSSARIRMTTSSRLTLLPRHTHAATPCRRRSVPPSCPHRTSGERLQGIGAPIGRAASPPAVLSHGAAPPATRMGTAPCGDRGQGLSGGGRLFG